MKNWSITSWTQFDYPQSATYPSSSQLNDAVGVLSQLPPLVTVGEINQLSHWVSKAQLGEAFLLQGGDCAESFADCQEKIIANKLKIILQMSLVLLHGLRKPVVRIGRIAGQYAKPRSSDLETINGQTLPSYRGDLVNSPSFDLAGRTPDPLRLLKGYYHASSTLNYIRALLNSGFADLSYPHQWDINFVDHSPQSEAYRSIVSSVADAMSFLDIVEGLRSSSLSKVDFFTSHEALHLHYEQALTRQMDDGLFYDLSTHLPWIGMRTAKLNTAHVEFLRGIHNPIGVKIGPNMLISDLISLIDVLNPQNIPGRLVLISRMGVDAIKSALPPIIHALKSKKLNVTWSCDPMHGNTETTADGIKTRHFDNILSELLQAVTIHRECGSHLGGVHFELTGDNVTECIGGARGLGAADLKQAYHSLVDPRLNYEQSLEMAFQLAKAFMS